MVEKTLIFGGTGFLGSRLIKRLKNEYQITVATRNPEYIKNRIEGVEYTGFTYDLSSFSELIENKDIIINFSGASVADKRWNDKYKQIMYDSRIKTTALISKSIISSVNKPHTFISTSATGIYGNRADELLTESSAYGNDYLAKMCIDWENEALRSKECGVRYVCIRVGVVLDKEEGGFKKMVQPFKAFVGGALGNGKQYLPWIHVNDIINIYIKAIKDKSIEGAVNGTSPNPVTSNEFSRTLGKVLNRPSIFKVPKFALSILLGEFAEFLTGSQRVIPEKLIEKGFTFEYKTIDEALINIVR